jgi:NitT/TauT family transport system ATP-binding protein
MQEMLVTIWQQTRKTILFITHDIEEALFLSERVYVMTARPGRIKQMLPVHLPHPRTLEMTTTPEFIEQKRVVLEAIKEETLKTINVAAKENTN